MTSKKYRPWDPDQAFLSPPAMRNWLEEDHLVYRLLDVVGSLDIRPVSHSIHAKDARGVRPYNPRMMLALLLYSYMNGIYSSRQIAAATYERIDFRVLTGDYELKRRERRLEIIRKAKAEHQQTRRSATSPILTDGFHCEA